MDTETTPPGRAAKADPSVDWTLAGFLARAMALERDAAERYQALADAMARCRNDDICALFRDMAEQSRQHHDSIAGHAQAIGLAAPVPLQPRGPAVEGDEAADPAMDAGSALASARRSEERALAYYSTVGQRALEPEVRRLAAEFAAEETEHLHALEDWLVRMQA